MNVKSEGGMSGSGMVCIVLYMKNTFDTRALTFISNLVYVSKWYMSSGFW